MILTPSTSSIYFSAHVVTQENGVKTARVAAVRTGDGTDPWEAVPVIDPTWGTLLTDQEAPVVALVNQHRAGLGLQPVRLSIGALTLSAEYKSMDMSGYLYLAHDDPAPIVRTVGQRIVACGYPGYDAWGENIAYGFTDPADVMSAWLSDSGHKANIETPEWTTIGVGVARASTGLIFWTQDFGTTDAPVPNGPPNPPPPPPPPPPPGPRALEVGDTWTPRSGVGASVRIVALPVGHVTYRPIRKNGSLGASVAKTEAQFRAKYE